MAWDLEVDTISVGSGAGGVTSAVASAVLGGRSLVLEKDVRFGGVTAYSGGQIWFGATKLARDLGIEDTLAATSDYLEYIGAGFSRPHMRTAYVRGGWAAEEFFDEIGVRLELIRGLPDYFYPGAPGSTAEGRYLEVAAFPIDRLGEWADKLVVSPHGLGMLRSADWLGVPAAQIAEIRARRLANGERCSGTGLMAALIHAALARGVDFRAEHRVVNLVREGGRVVGVVAETPAGVRRIKAHRGVVVATGGYDWNAALVRTYEHLTDVGSMTPPTVEGDHLIFAGELGAAVESFPSWSSPFHVGFVAEGMEVNGGPGYQNLQTGQPHSIVVNSRGLRFGDESFPQALEGAFAQFDGKGRHPSNWPAWLVFDQDFYERFLRTRGFGTLSADADIPADTPAADTISELAIAAGIDSVGLTDTVARFNKFCECGVDEDFDRGQMPWANLSWGDPNLQPNPMMAPVARPPYRAMRLIRVGVGIPSAGLVTDEVGRVMDVRGEPIEGLHAVGNAAARLETGAGYNSGIANGRGIVFGLLSARHLYS